MTTTQDIDPFAGADSVPAVSFKDAPIGTTYTGTVLEAPSLVQSRDYETGEPAVWKDGNPKMSVVVRLALDTGEEKNLWAAKPSAMFKALADAQKAAGARIAPGGTLAVRYIEDKPNSNPRLNAQKIYSAKYTAPDAFADSTPAASQSSAAAFNGGPAPAGVTSAPPF